MASGSRFQALLKMVCNLLVNLRMNIKCVTNAMNADDELTITAELPDAFPVTVIMERQPAKVSAWVDYIWKATGVTVGNTLESLPRRTGDAADYRFQATTNESQIFR